MKRKTKIYAIPEDITMKTYIDYSLTHSSYTWNTITTVSTINASSGFYFPPNPEIQVSAEFWEKYRVPNQCKVKL